MKLVNSIQKQVIDEPLVEKQAELMAVCDSVHLELDNQLSNVSDIQQQFGIIVKFLSEMKKQLFEIQQSLNEIKADVKVLKADVKEMKADIKYLIGKPPSQIFDYYKTLSELQKSNYNDRVYVKLNLKSDDSCSISLTSLAR